MEKREELNNVLKILEGKYPTKPALNFNNPFELLIATILSAQCTDKQVNKVTEVIFEKFKTPEQYSALTAQELGQYIKSCGFYKTKAENIINTCRILVERYDSRVPDTMEELVKLPGVGRKTANVVLSNAFGVDAIAVDTHVFRVSNRIGFADSKDVEKTEYQLMESIPKNQWSKAHHWLIYHGRNVCTARNPKCDICPITSYCKYHKNLDHDEKQS
jgi:endonuclease III